MFSVVVILSLLIPRVHGGSLPTIVQQVGEYPYYISSASKVVLAAAVQIAGHIIMTLNS